MNKLLKQPKLVKRALHTSNAKEIPSERVKRDRSGNVVTGVQRMEPDDQEPVTLKLQKTAGIVECHNCRVPLDSRTRKQEFHVVRKKKFCHLCAGVLIDSATDEYSIGTVLLIEFNSADDMEGIVIEAEADRLLLAMYYPECAADRHVSVCHATLSRNPLRKTWWYQQEHNYRDMPEIVAVSRTTIAVRLKFLKRIRLGRQSYSPIG